MKYVLSIDQSTQGTKALLFDENGRIVCRKDAAHEQLINSEGWVSHDPEEIYRNVLRCAREAAAGIDPADLVCMGISNQRETSLAWDRKTGRPVCPAIVWQCSRSRRICEDLLQEGKGDQIYETTGIPVSPFFPASKWSWILRNIPQAKQLSADGRLCFGTIDSWLIFCLTGGNYKTDFSNASRTQLLNLNTLAWDPSVCDLFGIEPSCLPEICDSDSVFGMTDLGGYLPRPIPVCGVLGDSHAALYGQGCFERGMVKATYGTGSSVMMNIGDRPILSKNGLVTSLAWKQNDEVRYVMEGNLNYTGGVIRWLQKDLQLIDSPEESERMVLSANPDDGTYFVPAFTGLGAPYWNAEARAAFYGISRVTGRAELVKAGVESIAYQIADIVKAMELDTGLPVQELRVDGGATNNRYLMQFQSDILNTKILKTDMEELSGIGAAYLAGRAAGLYDESIFDQVQRTEFIPQMPEEVREQKVEGWKQAVQSVLQ